MNYALIENGIVTNLIWLHPMNASEFSAVPINDLPIQIGDVYEDKKFYRNGKEITKEIEQRYTLDEAAEIIAKEASTNGYDA